MQKFNQLRKIKSQILVLDSSIEMIKSQINLHTVTCSDTPKLAGYGDKVLEKLTDQLNKLTNKKSRLQGEVDLILEELLVFPEMPRKVALYKEVYCLSWVQISKKTGYSCELLRQFYKEAKNFDFKRKGD